MFDGCGKRLPVQQWGVFHFVFLSPITGHALRAGHRVHVTARRPESLLEGFYDLTAQGFGDQDTAVVQAWIEASPRKSEP